MKIRKNSRRDQPDGKIPGTSAARDSGVNDPTRAPQSDRPMSFCPASVRLGRSEQAPNHRMLRGIACPGVPNRRLPPIPSATKTQHSDRSVSSEERGATSFFNPPRIADSESLPDSTNEERGPTDRRPLFFAAVYRTVLSGRLTPHNYFSRPFFRGFAPRPPSAHPAPSATDCRETVSRPENRPPRKSGPNPRPRSPAPPLPASRPRPESRVHRPALGFPAAPQKPHARLSPNPRLDATAPLRRYRRSALPPARGTQRNAPAVISRSFSRQRTTRSPSPAPPR